MDFKSTLNLPHTEFPLRPNPAVDDLALIERWKRDNLYQATFDSNSSGTKYILHDGPPYANGHIHLGHAYNKILKDILAKSYRMAGYHVPVTPGWDCHGLPIELKVTQAQPGLTPVEIKKACRAYAQEWIGIQKEEFRRLGVLMNWEQPYITMSPGYEASTMRAFGGLVQQGFIERKNKTVAWCFSCQTTLASAEIEYQDRKDPSVYVSFELNDASRAQLIGALNIFPADSEASISLLVWTTTPWTLPLNRAVALRPHTEYAVLRRENQYFIVGAQRAAALTQILSAEIVANHDAAIDGEKTAFAEFDSAVFNGMKVKHPLIDDLEVPIIFDDTVGVDEGTACVHTAPGCGPSDYELGVKHGLEIYSPITADGRYTTEIVPAGLSGMLVTDGQWWVLKQLAERGTLVHKGTLTHSYPHCWRCRNGLIFRATLQWFFDLQKDAIQQKAVQHVDDINFIPARGRNFLRSTVAHRWEWCLSRQRSWGVPIPALLCQQCNNAFISQELIEKVAQGVAQEGIEYWDHVSIESLVPADFACIACKTSGSWKKETDILDVWFDSGVSNYAVLKENPSLAFPADVYLEGVDQYRGWFQSSYLMALSLFQAPPMKTIISHGFTVDGNGQKMSKSLGNVVAPDEIIKQLGTDGLRLWVASIGNDSDAVVSAQLLTNVGEVFRKIRNTSRFLLQNLYDFDKDRDALPLEQLTAVDRYILHRVHALNTELIAAYHQADFTTVFHTLGDFCTKDLSAFYADILKDRLYVEKADGFLRRSAQTTLWYLLDTLTRLMAPVLSFTAEQLSDFYQKNKQQSIHLESFANTALFHQANAEEYDAAWEALHMLRTVVLKAIEVQREQGIIKLSLEAQIAICINQEHGAWKPLHKLFEQFATEDERLEFLRELLLVSKISYSSGCMDGSGCAVTVQKAEGVKCPRCWKYDNTGNEHGLCARCAALLQA